MFGSKPFFQVEPTTACNLNCEICMRSWLNRPIGFMDFNGFKKLLNLNHPTYIGFHGWGEPLLHNQIYDMIAYASSRKITTSLITNGTLLDEKKIRKLFSSGLKEFAFGVYKFERLEKVSEKILLTTNLKKEFKLKDPKIFLDITVYEGNVDEIPKIVEEASMLGVEAINLHRLFNQHNPSFKALDEEKEAKLFGEIKTLAKKLKLQTFLPSKHTNPCRVVKYGIYITWDFKVTPCCFLPKEYLADALSAKVKDIVKSQPYKDFVKNMGKHTVCSKCII